jgi:hypothetical protein
MRRLAAIVAMLCAAAHAEEFRAKAPIATQGSPGPFYRVQLPVEAYRDTRRDLADIRVVNASGEAVPMAFASEPEPEKAAPTVAVLPQFPVTSRLTPTLTASGTRLDLRVQTRVDGAVVSVEGRTSGKPAPKPVAYILDASQLKFDVGALRFDWDSAPGSEVVKVSVEASDDLREWRPLVARAALVRVEAGGQSLSQTRVAIGPIRARYFRITWDGAAFALKSVEAESAPATLPPERRFTTVALKETTKEGELVYDLGARLPVEALRVVFPETNSVAQYEVSVRDARDLPWRRITSGTFYRITRDGTEITSAPLEVGRRSSREWKLRPLVKGTDPKPPSLEAYWKPAEIVFVAKGAAPYSLVFGDPEARATAIQISALMPNYEKRAELRLPLTPVGDVQVVREDTPMQKLFGDIPPRKVALWAVLIFAVGVLGFIAWRLMKQMGSQGTR